jgi:phage protein D
MGMPTASGVRSVITVDGWPLDDEVHGYVEHLLVDDQLDLPTMFAITLVDPDHDILDRSGLRVGAEVDVSVVDEADQQEKPLAKGDVVTIECEYDQIGARVTVRGYAPSHRLHRGRQTRTFLNVTDSEIVKKVCGEAGIEIGKIEATSDVYEHVAQANASDWEFISARARQIGFEVAVVEGKLEFGPPRDSAEAPASSDADPDTDPTDPRLLIFGKNLLGFHGRLSAAEQVAEVEVHAWDTDRKEPVVVTAPAGTVAAQLELADPQSLASFFGDQTFISVSRPMASEPEATQAAKAIAERIGSSFVEADGVARGRAELSAGAAVNIDGVGEDFSGKYVLSHVRHVFDSEGYRTHFTISGRHDRSLLGMVSTGAAGAPAFGAGAANAAIPGLVRGIVSDNDDPEKMGRVKVSLPWLSADFSSAWAPVMQLGAGPKSGTMFLPAVGDEVLVGFEHGRIDWPIVVGGLFNGVDAPPTYEHLLDNGAVIGRSIVSRLGHEIIFNDDAQNHSGIAITTEGATVSVNLDAREQRLFIQSDGSVVVQAAGELKLKGEKVTIQADGELVLKGAQIKLN